MEKLTINHLSPYLPYGLKILNGWGDIKTLNYSHLDDENNGFITHAKPILRPLSDLDKEIDYGSKYGIRTLIKDHSIINSLSKSAYNKDQILVTYYHYDLLKNYQIFESLCELHFDLFGLIEKGIAIDINTLNT